MTTETKDLPPLPEKSYLGDDVSYGYEAWDTHAYALEAIRASATSAPEQKPIMRQPFSYEQDSALCEANCNAESDAFFAARPALDSDANRRIFYAGHRRAWISYPAASAIAQPTTPQPAEGV